MPFEGAEMSLPTVENDCGCVRSGSGGPAEVQREPAVPLPRESRRGFLGKLASIPAVGVLGRFLPIGREKAASAVVCYSWKYVGCERYCDCNCNEANSYYLYRRLCCTTTCWYEYYYAGFAHCGNFCGPCGAFLGYC